MTQHVTAAIEHRRSEVPGADRVLTPDALDLVARLHRDLNPERERLLAARRARQERFDAGEPIDFPPETADLRARDWQVAPAPADLNDRRVEITGPAERKMMINALNSGAKVFMADIEDALSPTWENVVAAQVNIADAVRRELALSTAEKEYRLDEQIATLVVRPRGWHLVERHATLDGEPVSASLFDFGLFMFHNAAELLKRGSGPYLYLPKLESRLEARLWNRAFEIAQEAVGVPQGSIRATVLVETITAALDMDEILYEIRDHAAGLNAGRWDYLFSVIKRLHRRGLELPDRSQLTMTVPFMRAYTELLVRTCHRRGAHAIGGMAAFIPSRKDAEVNERAIGKVREDKEREAGDGFDGTWVAHPDLVPVAADVFDRVLGDRPHQKHRLREEVEVSADDLLAIAVPGGTLTEEGFRGNVSVALQYLGSWLSGNGAAAINNLMEDAATAEIARSQLWHWRATEAAMDDGDNVTDVLYEQVRDEELERLGGRDADRLADAAEVLDALVLSDRFPEFLTLIAYERLD